MPAKTETEPATASKISRRKFGGRAAAAAALSLSPASLLTARGFPSTTAGSQTETKPEELAKLGITPEQAREVDARLANIVRKYGTRLSDEQRQHLRRILAYNERMLAGVRAFAVQNGDPPASVLRISFSNENKSEEQSARQTILKPQSVKPKPKR